MMAAEDIRAGVEQVKPLAGAGPARRLIIRTAGRLSAGDG
jgi:hypothetical protein